MGQASATNLPDQQTAESTVVGSGARWGARVCGDGCKYRATNGGISSELTLEILISITKLAKLTLVSHVELIL